MHSLVRPGDPLGTAAVFFRKMLNTAISSVLLLTLVARLHAANPPIQQDAPLRTVVYLAWNFKTWLPGPEACWVTEESPGPNSSTHPMPPMEFTQAMSPSGRRASLIACELYRPRRPRAASLSSSRASPK